MFANSKHYGFGFIKNTETNLSNWEPKPLTDLVKETNLPISGLTDQFENSSGCNPKKIKCQENFGIKLGKDNKEKDKRHDHDLIELVRKWIQSREEELLKTDTSQTAIPIICYDKAIRYARTQGYYKHAGHTGYAIKVKILRERLPSSEQAPDKKIKYYTWSVMKKNSEHFSTIDGIRFECHVFQDFYKTPQEGDDKEFQFFCLTSFDWTSVDKVIYRFFCIGEIDGVQEIGKGSGKYCAVEVKSFSATGKNCKIFYKNRLNEYYAKSKVSQIPRLIVGIKSDWDKEMQIAKYNEIWEYDMNRFPELKTENAEQERNLEKAIKVFHKNLNLNDFTTPKFLNGYVGKNILFEVKFEKEARPL